VLLNWCAFSGETKSRLAARFAQTCRPGTRFIAIVHPVEGERFRTLSTHTTLFTWGFEKVFVQELTAA
jgi:hypothetical protein